MAVYVRTPVLSQPGSVVTWLVTAAVSVWVWDPSLPQVNAAEADSVPVQVQTGWPQAWPVAGMVRASRVVSFLPSASLSSFRQTEHSQYALVPAVSQVAGTSGTAVRV